RGLPKVAIDAQPGVVHIPEEPMSGHAHHSPAEIRAKLKHPVIDGDGHWVEYDPVFAEQMRKVGGDKAADGFLAAMKTTRDSHPSPHFATLIAGVNGPAFGRAAAKASISGSRRCSGMWGMSS